MINENIRKVYFHLFERMEIVQQKSIVLFVAMWYHFALISQRCQIIFLRHAFKRNTFVSGHGSFSSGLQTKITPNLTQTISFDQFKTKMLPFDIWKFDVKTRFSDSTDEALRKIYEAHSANLYRLYKACHDVNRFYTKGKIH